MDGAAAKVCRCRHMPESEESESMYCFPRYALCALVVPTLSLVSPAAIIGQERDAPPPSVTEVNWLTDYATAYQDARRQGKMLLLRFCDPENNPLCARLDRETMSDPTVRRKLQNFVCVRVPVDATITVEGKQTRLLDHSGFAEMLGQPGVAIIDLAHRDTKHYGRVVSAFPLTSRLWYTPAQMAVILDLPPGSITQRTLIYAVRTHPERPASTDGEIDTNLEEEAESHSQYQARIRLQGHHRWESRFHRIRALLPGGLTAIEVCAESWPGERLVEAAIDCVRSWRQSSGHWSAVRSRHPYYGYDMKRGPNGVWYATGIFGRR